MSWKEIRNNQPSRKDVSYSGKCPRFHKEATVTGTYFGRYMGKDDIIKTYSLSGYTCTLSDSFCPMEHRCPLMPKNNL